MGRLISILSLSLLLILCHTGRAESQPATLGLYFDQQGNVMDGMPPALTVFDAYLILKDAEYYVTAVEFQLLTPDDPTHALLAIVDVVFPQENTLELGDPWSGISIAYWPPLDGFANDNLLLCTLKCFLTEPCTCHSGSLTDFPIVVGPHPDSGELRGTYAPDHETFPIMGFTSVMCPHLWWPLICNVIITAEDEIIAAFCSPISDASAEDESRYRVIEHVSPPETLTVINASRHSSGSARLTLERSMIDQTTYTLITNNICEEYDCACGNQQFEYYFRLTIGTVLQSFSAEQHGADIVITWRMADIDAGVDFRVLRDEDDRGFFADIPSPAITNEGLEYRFTDRNAEAGHTYRYRIEYVEDGVSNFLFETEPVAVPALSLTLHQNSPNPFNPSTTIRFYLPERGRAVLDIYDTTGKRIIRLVDRELGKGTHRTDWNGVDANGISMASGVYFYRLSAGKATITKKMILLK